MVYIGATFVRKEIIQLLSPTKTYSLWFEEFYLKTDCQLF